MITNKRNKGRKPLTLEVVERINNLLDKGTPYETIADEVGISIGTIHNINYNKGHYKREEQCDQ